MQFNDISKIYFNLCFPNYISLLEQTYKTLINIINIIITVIEKIKENELICNVIFCFCLIIFKRDMPKLTKSINVLKLNFGTFHLQDRIMVSLTLMLVIATIVSSIQMTLPVTPYLKMIDVWLFAATNMMGYLLIFHTYIEFKLKYSSNKHSGLLFTRRNSKWGNVTESSTRYKQIVCKVVLSEEAQIVYITVHKN